ncbi:MAG: DUF4199 domain-containing protein [Urechidicola sp.]|nr:DUF4199 domain-containing protein [Urechidicola sp.]
MENQTTSSKQVMLTYGLMLGLATILISVINYAIGDIYKPHWSIQVVGLLAIGVLIVLGVKKFKNENLFLSLGQSIKIGLGIALIGAIISLVYTLVFIKVIEPEFIPNTIEIETQKMYDQGQGEEQIEMAVGFMKNYMMIMIIAMIIISNLFVGFIVSLISGVIMKESNEEVTSI